jgi:hypothetical protein
MLKHTWKNCLNMHQCSIKLVLFKFDKFISWDRNLSCINLFTPLWNLQVVWDTWKHMHHDIQVWIVSYFTQPGDYSTLWPSSKLCHVYWSQQLDQGWWFWIFGVDHWMHLVLIQQLETSEVKHLLNFFEHMSAQFTKKETIMRILRQGKVINFRESKIFRFCSLWFIVHCNKGSKTREESINLSVNSHHHQDHQLIW